MVSNYSCKYYNKFNGEVEDYMFGNYSCNYYKKFNGEVEDAGKVDFPV